MFQKEIFLCFLQTKQDIRKYLTAIFIGFPNWYVIGILITFSKEFGAKMNIRGAIDPGKSVMFAYAAISIGDILIGFVSKWLKSRKKALYIFYAITVVGIVWFFNLNECKCFRVIFGLRFAWFWNRILGNICYHGG